MAGAERYMLDGTVGARTAAGHPAPDEPYKSAVRVANVAVALLAVHIVFDVFAAAVDVQMLGLLDRAREGALVTLDETQALTDRMRRTGMLQYGGVVAVLVPFVVWTRRVYRNLRSLGTRRLRFKAGWAVAGWFVPFLQFARPKSILNDVWRASDPELPREILGPPPGAGVPAVVNWWWAALVTCRLIYPDGLLEAGTLDRMTFEVQRVLVGDVLLIVAGVLAIRTVLKLTRRQEQRRARLVTETGAAPL